VFKKHYFREIRVIRGSIQQGASEYGMPERAEFKKLHLFVSRLQPKGDVL